MANLPQLLLVNCVLLHLAAFFNSANTRVTYPTVEPDSLLTSVSHQTVSDFLKILPESLNHACNSLRYITHEFGSAPDTEIVIRDTSYLTQPKLDSVFAFIRKHATVEGSRYLGDSTWVQTIEADGFVFRFTYTVSGNKVCPVELVEYFF